MSITEDRIESLSKEALIQKNFSENGLDIDFFDLRLTLKKEDNGKKQFERLVSAVHRKVKKTFFTLSYEEKVSFIEKIFSPLEEQISVTSINPSDSEYDTYLQKLLAGCTNLSLSHDFSIKYTPASLSFQNSILDNGYTLLSTEIKKKYHKSKARLPRSGYEYLHIYDISSLLAEYWTKSALIRFAEQHKDIVRFLVLSSVQQPSYSVIPMGVPIGIQFRKDFLDFAKKCNFPLQENCHESIFPATIKDTFYGRFSSQNAYFLHLVAPEFISQMNYVREKTKNELESTKSYAKSFQTKKNIKKSTLKTMKDNYFRQFYGFVELDNNVDLEKFNKIEEEFRKFTDVISIPKCFDHSFRIKKLGKHRAEGIYFPYFKATIFDPNHPDSYCHELGHQIDYTQGKKSEQIEFRNIIETYKKLVLQCISSLAEDHPFRVKWESKNKYNQDYFFQNTEIFARCFELYLFNKNVYSSLLPTSFDSPEYPLDSYFLTLVSQYFESFLLKKDL